MLDSYIYKCKFCYNEGLVVSLVFLNLWWPKAYACAIHQLFELTCLAKSTFLAMKNSLRLLLKFLSAIVGVSNAGSVSFEGITGGFAAIFPFSFLDFRSLVQSTCTVFFFSTLPPFNSISWSFFFYT